MAPFAVLRPAIPCLRSRLALTALICVAGIAAPIGQRAARAGDCTMGSGPARSAGTSALYGELSDKVNAEPLSVDIIARAIGGACVWVYEVKVLTAHGSVALLDFDLVDLGLKRVQGAREDPDIAKLYDRLSRGGNGQDAAASSSESGSGSSGGSGSGSGSVGSGSGGSGSGGSGSGGSGGSGSGGSGGGGGSGGSGGGGEGGDD